MPTCRAPCSSAHSGSFNLKRAGRLFLSAGPSPGPWGRGSPEHHGLAPGVTLSSPSFSTLVPDVLNHSPLEGESQKPSQEAKAEAVGGQPAAPRSSCESLSSPHRRAGGLAPLSCRLPLKGGVMRRGLTKDLCYVLLRYCYALLCFAMILL